MLGFDESALCDTVEQITGIPFLKRPTYKENTRWNRMVNDWQAIGAMHAIKNATVGTFLDSSTSQIIDELRGEPIATYYPKTHRIMYCREQKLQEYAISKNMRVEEPEFYWYAIHETTHAHTWRNAQDIARKTIDCLDRSTKDSQKKYATVQSIMSGERENVESMLNEISTTQMLVESVAELLAFHAVEKIYGQDAAKAIALRRNVQSDDPTFDPVIKWAE